MSCIISNCTYVTTPGYDHLQQLALHVPKCPIAVPKDNGGPGTKGRHQELAALPPTPQGGRIPLLFDLNTSNTTQTRQKHGSEQDQDPPSVHQQAPAHTITYGNNPVCTYVMTNVSDHPQQTIVTNLEGNPSEILDRSVKMLHLSPVCSGVGRTGCWHGHKSLRKHGINLISMPIDKIYHR